MLGATLPRDDGLARLPRGAGQGAVVCPRPPQAPPSVGGHSLRGRHHLRAALVPYGPQRGRRPVA
eukprot:8105397-Alexandrium_andersonii.AAC.1